MSTPSKGVRNANKLKNELMSRDRQRGLTWRQIALKHRVDFCNGRKRVVKWMAQHGSGSEA